MQFKNKADIFANLAGNQKGNFKLIKKYNERANESFCRLQAILAYLIKHSVVIERNYKL